MTEKKVFKRALEMMSERFVRLAMELYHNYQSSEGVRQHYIEKAEAELKEHNGTA